MRFGWGRWVVGAALVLVACVQQPEDRFPESHFEAGAAPPVFVVGDGSVPVVPGLGGTSGQAGQDAAPPSSSDGPRSMDAAAKDAAAPDVAPKDAAAACDLIVQTCSNKAQACYPSASGPACLPQGAGDELGRCADHDDCDEGLACVGAVCRYMCNIDLPACAEKKKCKADGALKGIGFCSE